MFEFSLIWSWWPDFVNMKRHKVQFSLKKKSNVGLITTHWRVETATPEFYGKQGREGSWKKCVCLSCRFVCRDPLIKRLYVPSPFIPTALQLIFFTYLGPIRISQIAKVCRIIRKRYIGQHIHICPLPKSLHFFCDCLLII